MVALPSEPLLNHLNMWRICLCVTVFVHVVISEEHNMECGKVEYAYSAKGFNGEDVPKHPVSGQRLRVCTFGLTCCTEEMEHKLSTQSRQEFDRNLRDTIQLVGRTLSSKSRRFDEFFRDLLRSSKEDFHNMFRQTYGILYMQNSHVFTDLFTELEAYYDRGTSDLSRVMADFFTTLYQKMFTVLNAQYKFTARYLECVTQHMDELKPFGDVPPKLTQQVKRSFVATRTLVQGLMRGRDIIDNIQRVTLSPECSHALMKMSYCPACQGLPDLKPCNNYCMNVMKGCLAHHTQLNEDWDAYVDALLDVIGRLEGPFNIEAVVEPIDIKISGAIMNFQESAYEVTQMVFKGCGKPRLGTRDLPELDTETWQFTTTAQESSEMDRLLDDMKKKLRTIKGFWNQLPYHLCNNEQIAAGPGQDDQCWNGLDKARYEAAVTADGILSQEGNPEVRVDSSVPNSRINDQIVQLRVVTRQLRKAYDGRDVSWTSDDWVLPGSEGDDGEVEGSGDGSGYGITDDEDINIDGSGDPYVVVPPVVEEPKRGRGRNKNKGKNRGKGRGKGRGKNRGRGEYDWGQDIRGSYDDEDEIEFERPYDVDLYDDRRPDGDVVVDSGGSGATRTRMSLLRAVYTFVAPSVVIWIGSYV